MKAPVYFVLSLVLLCLSGWSKPTAAAPGGNGGAKPVVCPRYMIGEVMCAEFCSNDKDCPRKEKCCYNGCGHQCAAPYKEKPGECPFIRFGHGMCMEFCFNDGDCPGKYKCCFNGCGRECTAPYRGK